jgi:putative MFS transporter
LIEPSCYHRTRFPVFAALLGYLIVPATPSGWQIVQMITAVPILMLLWWRRVLPESPRWLIERGRFTRALRTLATA